MRSPIPIALFAVLLLVSGCSQDTGQQEVANPPTSTATPAPGLATPQPIGSEMTDTTSVEVATVAPTAEPTATLVATPAAPTPTTAPPTPTPFPTATPSPTPVPRNCVAEIPLRTALGQLIMPLASPGDFVTVGQLAAADEIGGVAMLGSPTVEEMALLQAGDAGTVLPLLIASDEEGGTVQRLRVALGPLPSAAEMTGLSVDAVRERIATYGGLASNVGVTMAFGPVVDVGAAAPIGSRSFSGDAQVVTQYGAAVVAGWQQAGVIPVLKHFPGHGKASGDTHLGFATVPAIEQLRQDDLLPYGELLQTPGVAVMVAHVQVPGLTGDLPASLSPDAITGLLREELGFQGVVITDALDMQAIALNWDAATASEMALLAGADIAMVPSVSAVGGVLASLEQAVADGRLTRERVDESLSRILNMRSLDPCTVADALGT